MATKIIGVSASPRKNQSSRFLLEASLQQVKTTAAELQEDVETELVDLAGLNIRGCLVCNKCTKDLHCSQQDDFLPLIPKFEDPNLGGIIIATPVYMGSMSSQAKAFIDRTVMFRRNGFLFRDKIGGVITVGGSRNGGQEITIQAVHAAMMIHDMIIVGNGTHLGGTGWNDHTRGYREDSNGVNTAEQLGARMARTVLKLTE